MFVSTPLVRSTAAVRIDIKTHPHTLNDIQVQSVVAQPGGNSGWHSHPGYGIVVVKSGAITLYDGDDPTCTPREVGAGEVFTEEPGHIHFARNEGTVPYEAYATFVLPVGVPSRTDVS
jgi:quercetin dioxygenase-like cupin family protein